MYVLHVYEVTDIDLMAISIGKIHEILSKNILA